MDTQGGVEPAVDLAAIALANRKGIVTSSAASENNIQEGDKDDDGSNNAEEAEVSLAQGVQHPAATK